MKAEYLKRFNETYPACNCDDKEDDTSPMLRPRLYTYPLFGKPKSTLSRNEMVQNNNSTRKWQKTLPNLQEDVIEEAKDEADFVCSCSCTNDKWIDCYDQRLSASPFSAKRRSYSFPSPRSQQNKTFRYKFGVTVMDKKSFSEQLPLIQEITENEGEESQNRVTINDDFALMRKCKTTVSPLDRISQNAVRMPTRNKRQYNVWRGLQRSFAEDGKMLYPDL